MMMTTRRILLRNTLGLGLTAVAGGALAACTSPNPTYYRMATLPGTPQPGGPPAVTVRSVSIPGYLDRDGIVKGGGDYKLDIHSNELWAEDFASMLQNTMVEDLSQRLPGSTVTPAGGSVSVPADVLIEINLLRFDPDADGRLVMIAQIAVKSGSSRDTWGLQLVRQEADASKLPIGGVVAVMSRLWAVAADTAASLVVQGWAAHPHSAAG